MVLALLVTACGNTTGIWLARVPASADPPSCESDFDENFNEGYRPSGGGGGGSDEWVLNSESTGADFVFFFEITQTEDGGGALVNDGKVYPGTYDGETWTFTWADVDEMTETAEHVDGYSFAHTSSSTETTTIEFRPTGIGLGEGSWSEESRDAEGFYADDEWDPEDYAGGYYDMPTADSTSAFYLVYEDDGAIYAQDNDAEEDDCAGNTCEATSSQVCTRDFTFSATRTNKDDTDSYDYLDDATNGSEPAGAS